MSMRENRVTIRPKDVCPSLSLFYFFAFACSGHKVINSKHTTTMTTTTLPSFTDKKLV